MHKRGRGKVIIDKGMYDAYLFYRKYVEDHNIPEHQIIDRQTFGRVIRMVHEHLMHHVLYEAGSFKMPAGLPLIRIKKYKRRIKFKEDGKIDGSSMAPNWPKTMELWEKSPVAKKQKKIVYHINDHTDGHSAMVWMDKYRSRVPNIYPYQFRACRAINRKLAAILLDPYNKIDYYS